jgi:oligoendopeptidase F
MVRVAKTEIVWDLSEMFPSTTDPSVQKAVDDLSCIAEDFANKYDGKISSLSAQHILQCIQEFEAYRAKLEQITLYAELSYAANMTLPETQALYDKANKIKAKLNKRLAFFELDLGNLVYKKPEMIHEPALKNYMHFLEKLRRQVPNQLTEAEEKIIIEKDQFGVAAWEQLQSKWLGTRTFEVEVEGKKKTLSFTEAFGLYFHPDRATRESANRSINVLLEKDGEIFSSALRNICNDWRTICERRKYGSPIHASLMTNDIDEQTINNLLKTVEDHADLYQRYLKLKAKLMGLPKLSGHDVPAPLPDPTNVKFDYEKAKTIVIEAYNRFDEELASAAKEMFARNHVDSSPRFGKQGGAFCVSWSNGKSSFIFQSFNGRLDDIYAFVHEMGHAIHNYYIHRNQSILNGTERYFPMVVAETASTFGELLLTDLLLNNAQSDQEKAEVLCTVLDGAGFNTFKNAARCRFEQSLYDAIKRGEFLDYETISKYWNTARNRIHGDAVDWSDEMKAEWARLPHYFLANFRFYNYPYTYAQTFVYALYEKHLKEGKEFVPKFKRALSAGCSISPVEIGKIVGLDVTDADFWELGLKQYERFVEELEKIVS